MRRYRAAAHLDAKFEWLEFDPIRIIHPTWLVDKLIPEHSTCCIYGAPNTGKSFLVLDMALAIATGRKWLDLDTRITTGKTKERGKVVYILAESPEGLNRRIAAWLNHRGLSREEGVTELAGHLFIPKVEHLQLDNPRGFSLLVSEINSKCPDVSLIILDPLVSFMEGDENNAGDTQSLINATRKLTEQFKESHCSVLMVHHSGKDYARGERGSSALRGGVDTHLRLTHNRLEVEKQRDAGKAPDIYIEFVTAVEHVDGEDRDLGKIVTKLDFPPEKKRPPNKSNPKSQDTTPATPITSVKPAISNLNLVENPTRMQKRAMENRDAVIMAMAFLQSKRTDTSIPAGEIYKQMGGTGFKRFKGKKSSFYAFMTSLAMPPDDSSATLVRVAQGKYRLASHIMEELQKTSVPSSDVPSQNDPSRPADVAASTEGHEP